MIEDRYEYQIQRVNITIWKTPTHTGYIGCNLYTSGDMFFMESAPEPRCKDQVVNAFRHLVCAAAKNEPLATYCSETLKRKFRLFGIQREFIEICPHLNIDVVMEDFISQFVDAELIDTLQMYNMASRRVL